MGNVKHNFREFNEDTDGLANRSADSAKRIEESSRRTYMDNVSAIKRVFWGRRHTQG